MNTIIYLDEINNYPGWAIFLVFLGISVLVYGVYLLSSKPDPTSQNEQQDQHDQQQQQDNDDPHMIVYVPSSTDQELQSIAPTTTSSTSTANMTPPEYTDNHNNIPVSDDHKNNNDEKSLFKTTTLTSPPASIMAATRQITSFSDPTAISTTTTATMDLKLKQQQSFISASIIDDTIHERHSHSKKSWVKKLLSTALPWKISSSAYHQREDTFLSLHSTDASTSTTVSSAINNNVVECQDSPHYLTKRTHRCSQISESSDKEIIKNS